MHTSDREGTPLFDDTSSTLVLHNTQTLDPKKRKKRKTNPEDSTILQELKSLIATEMRALQDQMRQEMHQMKEEVLREFKNEVMESEKRIMQTIQMQKEQHSTVSSPKKANHHRQQSTSALSEHSFTSHNEKEFKRHTIASRTRNANSTSNVFQVVKMFEEMNAK